MKLLRRLVPWASGLFVLGWLLWPALTAFAAGPFNLYGSDIPPNVTGSGSRTNGLLVETSEAGTIEAIRWYSPEGHAGAVASAGVMTTGGTLLGSVSSPPIGASGWLTWTLPSPVSVGPGEVWVLVEMASGTPLMGYEPGVYPGPGRTSGPLTALDSGTATGSGLLLPTGSTGTDYFVDVVFTTPDEPTTTTTTPTTTTTTVAPTSTVPTCATAPDPSDCLTASEATTESLMLLGPLVVLLLAALLTFVTVASR